MTKQKRWQWLIIILIVAVATVVVVQAVSADIYIPPPFEIVKKIFEDVTTAHPFATFIKWLKDNGITGGYPDGTYRPDNYITRAEMAAMLKNTAKTVVAAGVHVVPKSGGGFEIEEWFNNVNGTKPTDTYFIAHLIDFDFDYSDKLVMCSVDSSTSVTAFCSVEKNEENVQVTTYDIDGTIPVLEPVGFWLLVYGNDIQP